VARSTAGTAGSHVTRIDANDVRLFASASIAAGYAHSYWRVSAEHHARALLQAPYLMVTYVFLGEQPAIGGGGPALHAGFETPAGGCRG
jgi:hypothetical protein